MLDKRVDPTDTSGILEPRFHPPGDAVLTNLSASGSAATATAAALTGGGKYVVTAFSFSLGQGAAGTGLNATTIGCNIIDGASGGSTFLWREILGVGSTGGQIFRNGLNLVGSANTALTVEFSAGVTGAVGTINASYHRLAGPGV
jgi:hypothetical protein